MIAFFAIMAKEVVNTTRQSDSTLVVVARTNIVAGTQLTREFLAKKRVPDAILPKHYACPHTADLLVGAHILSDIKRADPIDLEQTDLWKGEKEPQPTSPGDAATRAAPEE